MEKKNANNKICRNQTESRWGWKQIYNEINTLI